MMMDQLRNCKLFSYGSLDLKDDLEEKFERGFQYYEQQTTGLNDKELHELVSELACKDKQHEDISIGLLFIILTDAQVSSKTYRDLTLVTRDGFCVVTSNLSLLAEKYSKLCDVARRQLLWVLRELVKNQVVNVDKIVWNCLRQASGGDISAKNLFLIEGLLDIFIDYRLWLEKHSYLVGAVIYSYVRLIEDHANPMLTNLRNKEVKFVISLIREKFIEVMSLGRDFVRLLQNVSKIPEFELLWRDILYNPKSLCPTFTGVWQLLQNRTSRRILQCRLTPEMERKLHFLASFVKFGNQKRYQDWFQEKYFSTPESQSLRSDLIRFIINAIHPTNDMLCSDIIPRWAIIGWLLTSCTNPAALANAKLALFYDWLFFDPNKDNIMNIEPGILVMYNSIKNHPFVSCTLLDFLCRILKSFSPGNEEKIKAGVYNSLRIILDKQVIPHLQPLFDSSKLDRDLRFLIRDTFREFCVSATNVSATMLNTTPDVHIVNNFGNAKINEETRHFVNSEDCRSTNFNFSNQMATDLDTSSDAQYGDIVDIHKASHMDNEAVFSDEEEESGVDLKSGNITDEDDDLPLSKMRLKEKPSTEKIELPDEISDLFEEFLRKKTTYAFEEFLNVYKSFTTNNIDQQQSNFICHRISSTIKQNTPNKILPESKSDEKLITESMNYLIFGLFRHMYTNEEKNKKPFQTLLISIHQQIPQIGYLLLFFLKAYTKIQSRKNTLHSYSFKISIYKYLCDSIEEKLDECLVCDLDALEKESNQIFLWLLPDVYRECKSYVINNSDMNRLLLSSIDAKNLRDLVYNIMQGKFALFKKDSSLISCIKDSLNYETFEQFCFWQLIQAHDVPMEYLQDILPELESSNHSEALISMLLLLKNEEPTTELLRLLLSRDTKYRGDPFVTSTLRFWCRDYEDKLSEVIGSILTSKYPHSSPNKRKRPVKSNVPLNNNPTAEQLLAHLEHFRRSCRHGNGAGTGLYVQDSMQRALQQAFSHSTDATKKQYSDLFALAAEDETSLGRRGGTGRGRKHPNNKKDGYNGNNLKKNTDPVPTTYSSDEESTDDEWAKSKQPKRRKITQSDSE